MIYDRTQQDVSDALRIRTEKVQHGETLTSAEEATLARGMLSIDTLTRVEGKTGELRDIFLTLGYFGFTVDVKTWTCAGIFTGADFRRVLNNLNELRKAFFTYTGTPPTPDAKYDYITWNAIERILHDLDEIKDSMVAYTRKCGTFVCGEERA